MSFVLHQGNEGYFWFRAHPWLGNSPLMLDLTSYFLAYKFMGKNFIKLSMVVLVRFIRLCE